jgi:hypothetical protein
VLPTYRRCNKREIKIMDVILELKEIGALFSAGDFRTSLKKLWDLWKQIPDPKVETSNAYMVIEYGVAFCLKMRELDEAQKWAVLAPPFRVKRQDRGEVEFLVGKVAFERGEVDIARENFIAANTKSKGRIFQGEDPKYKALIK